MDSLDQLARFEVASSAVAFRECVYGDDDRLTLLRDLLGLANAPVKGSRYIFLGIDDSDDFWTSTRNSGNHCAFTWWNVPTSIPIVAAQPIDWDRATAITAERRLYGHRLPESALFD